MQRPEFYRAGDIFDNMLFIDDRDRSWGNNIDFEAMFASLAPFLAGRSVCCLGNSMGGFNAILATNFLPIDVCLSVVPRYTVRPEFALPDGEVRDYLDVIREWRFPTLEGQFNDQTDYRVISGSSSTESCHTELFPVLPNLHHYVLRPSNHGLVVGLKKAGVLPDVIASAWDGSMTAARLATLTGKKIDVLSGPEHIPPAVAAPPAPPETPPETQRSGFFGMSWRTRK